MSLKLKSENQNNSFDSLTEFHPFKHILQINCFMHLSNRTFWIMEFQIQVPYCIWFFVLSMWTEISTTTSIFSALHVPNTMNNDDITNIFHL